MLDLSLRADDRKSTAGAVRSAMVAALLFAAGSFVGMLAFGLAARAFGLRLGEPGEDVARHFVTMLLGGFFMGAAIGVMTARRIANRLLPRNAA